MYARPTHLSPQPSLHFPWHAWLQTEDVIYALTMQACDTI
jgi:hypothetical protein